VKPVRKEKPAPSTSAGGAGYLLASMVPLVFCSGLLGLAVSPAFEVAVPRGLILAWGAGCAVVALVAPLLSGPGQQRPAPVPFPRAVLASVARLVVLRQSHRYSGVTVNPGRTLHW
jgi:hypothetical protein